MLDRMEITAEEAYFLDPQLLEDVEYLSPTEALKEAPFAINGLLKIRTRLNSKQNNQNRRKGKWCSPLGLSN